MLQFFKFCLTRLHAQISSQVLRESDEIQGWFEVGCPGAQSLVCHDLGNALQGFLWKMEVPPVANIIAHFFFSWIHILLWKKPLGFFSRSLSDSHVPHKWLSMWFTFGHPGILCPFRCYMLSPQECICVPVLCVCSSEPVTCGSYLLCHNYFEWSRKRVKGNLKVASYKMLFSSAFYFLIPLHFLLFNMVMVKKSSLAFPARIR